MFWAAQYLPTQARRLGIRRIEKVAQPIHKGVRLLVMRVMAATLEPGDTDAVD
jgi:hypothetical protein